MECGVWAFTPRRRGWISEVSIQWEETALVSLPSEACRPAAALSHPGLDRAQQAWQEQRKENELVAALGGMGTVGGRSVPAPPESFS